MNKRQVGSRYENLAAAYLIKKGYQIIAYNYRGKRGEIDLIARDARYLVFIEVKYRRNGGKGDPAEAVNDYKQRQIRNTARYYLYTNGYSEEEPCRFDVVCITGDEIRVLTDAFE